MKRVVLRATLLLATALLAACTTVPPLPPAASGESISGRLALRVEALGTQPARALSAAFDLRGGPGGGALTLATPIGTLLARADWSPGDVRLTTPEEIRRYPDLDALTRDVLGESVPIEAWFDWLHGRPWPDAPSRPADDGAGFEQLGWSVDLSRFGAGAVAAVRDRPAPAVRVRIQLDRS